MSKEEHMNNDLQVLVKQTMEKMIEGCRNVKEDKNMHDDAKQLAILIIHECHTLLRFTIFEEKST